MLSSRRNLGVAKQDQYPDEWYRVRKPKARERGQKGKRTWRRVLRAWEKSFWRKELRKGEM